jgi:hypothetical protein
MPNNAKSPFAALLEKQGNIWITTIVVLLIMWFVISMFVLASGHKPFAIKYNSSYACGNSTQSYTSPNYVNTGKGAKGNTIHLGTSAQQYGEDNGGPCDTGKHGPLLNTGGPDDFTGDTGN